MERAWTRRGARPGELALLARRPRRCRLSVTPRGPPRLRPNAPASPPPSERSQPSALRSRSSVFAYSSRRSSPSTTTWGAPRCDVAHAVQQRLPQLRHATSGAPGSSRSQMGGATCASSASRPRTAPRSRCTCRRRRRAGPAGGFDEHFVDLGDLKGNIGSQNYAIPAEVHLDRYRSVVVSCKLQCPLRRRGPVTRLEPLPRRCVQMRKLRARRGA